ncbi:MULTISPECIES: bifunctional transaldolase/phosoglucose isomerase [unclassified Leptolyngbya]|uniref:bifunctional transaldolase/phosoglucose isomerase n=1 Tax=unclassified Leptolyngbya TaxID=2650499 RepID=UPI001682167B|nr:MULTISPECIES: bifunctional transaldolase/phosoglucose isomerase [unclassified Leptolyngbya]MBD1913143.1 bifunctional transaldolase/phosoglucose isomerase [Leptolyngbya sp. FACHB-8]MBD2158818.1 bifunctional transaldolase/phosoglucose isomerase [Leptolyngbya sp. FACHB-16]
MVTVQVSQIKNSLQALQSYGQSVWLDYIRRSLITSGELQQLIDENGLRGVTSNPSIFEKAIAGSTDYDTALSVSEHTQDRDVMSLYESFAIADIQTTADILKPIYDQTNRRDGYISLEVSPYLANDTERTISEARRLWREVDRPNLMIKVPATPAGIPAIQQLIGEGINVNVTLLFAKEVYEQVANAYITGLEILEAKRGDISRVASVASFFISRIDTAVDNLITAQLKATTDAAQRDLLKGLLGKVAIANAKLAYKRYQDIYSSSRWQKLTLQGAQTQRLLWASTGTKNLQYSDVLYVEELVGSDTVNTIPPATLSAFGDHGHPRPSLTEGLDEARSTIIKLQQAGISLQQTTDQLLAQGVELFQSAFDQLLTAVENKRTDILSTKLNRLTYKLSDALNTAVQTSLNDWQEIGKIRRLWAQDSTLWTGTDENKWLGWLGITEDQLAHIDHLKQLAQEVQDLEFTHVLLLGMGGSSLCPEVMKLTFGNVPGFPKLLVLDSTDPAQIKAIENQIELPRTLFIVSSKSGSTLEPNIFKQYFFDRLQQIRGAESAGNRFVAVTDPGSKLQHIAEGDDFRHVFFGMPSIGGRYSALSNFGMVPAAAMGVDVARFLDTTEVMVHSCASSVPAKENPGVVLGTILGVLAKQGRDKVTLITSPGIADLGAWLEQLLAESTGKDGKGLIPVDQEPLGTPEMYGSDRIFAYIRLESAPDVTQDTKVAALEHAGQPVVRISVADPYQIGQEFFRWEIATAVAGSIIGIHAFNQPDVEASKIVTRQLTEEYEKTRKLPPESPFFAADGIQLFTDSKNAAALKQAVGESATITDYLRAHLNRLQAGDYFALLAYIDRNDAYQKQLQAIRATIRDAKKVATCLGFGPRFLHSTGQAYKGGPNSGVFLQITCDDAIDISVPQQKYTFSVVKAAQARGDFQVLAERDRRALRFHLGKDVEAGLAALRTAIEQIL